MSLEAVSLKELSRINGKAYHALVKLYQNDLNTRGIPVDKLDSSEFNLLFHHAFDGRIVFQNDPRETHGDKSFMVLMDQHQASHFWNGTEWQEGKCDVCPRT